MSRFEEYGFHKGGEVNHRYQEVGWNRIFYGIRPQILDWIRATLHPRAIWEDVSPDKVFHHDELEEWALENGFVRDDDRGAS